MSVILNRNLRSFYVVITYINLTRNSYPYICTFNINITPGCNQTNDDSWLPKVKTVNITKTVTYFVIENNMSGKKCLIKIRMTFLEALQDAHNCLNVSN